MNPDYTLALHSSYKDDYRYIIPFHIDYVFASPYFLNKLEKVEIGEHDAWISHSEHMPTFSSFHT